MGNQRTRRHMLELEANLERAGYALACPFTSSSEFEAAVIRANRQAGAYGPRRHRRLAVYAAGLVSGMFVVACLMLVTFT
jgi:type IV secretory pathway component VirB8